MLLKKLAAVLFCLILVFFAPACRAGDNGSGAPVTEAPDPLTVCLDAARGGNLHYYNFVLTTAEAIYYTDIDGNLAGRPPAGGRTRILADHEAGNLALAEDTLFYTQGITGGFLHKISSDGTNQVRIGRNSLKYLVTADNLLYAIENGSGKAVRLNPDGTGRQELSDSGATALFYRDNKLYISSQKEGIIEIDLETDVKRTVTELLVSSLNVYGDWLYFTDPSRHNLLYAWSLQTGTGGPISDFSLEKPFIISDGYLYGILPLNQNRLYRWPVAGDGQLELAKAQLVIDDAVNLFVVCADKVYYQRPDCKRIYVKSFSEASAARFS